MSHGTAVPRPVLHLRPVLYLDLDDTLLTWAGGGPAAARGAAEFLLWALDEFEVRWLTRWCPSGTMTDPLLHDLSRILRLDAQRLRDIRGIDWQDSDCKLDGIAWLEHIAVGRPFVWLEDEYGVGSRELAMLDGLGLRESYIHCNVTCDERALSRVHAGLRAAAVAA